jgi:hypothetical protein
MGANSNPTLNSYGIITKPTTSYRPHRRQKMKQMNQNQELKFCPQENETQYWNQNSETHYWNQNSETQPFPQKQYNRLIAPYFQLNWSLFNEIYVVYYRLNF